MKPAIEQLEDRLTPSGGWWRHVYQDRDQDRGQRQAPGVTALWNGSVLTVTGTDQADAIVVGAAAGLLTVTSNGQVVPIASIAGPAYLANTTRVVIFGQGGDDNLQTAASLNTRDGNGVLVYSPDVEIHGGDGNDTIQVNSGGIVGGAVGVVNGVVVGRVVGNATMYGDAGDDTLISGFGNDFIYGGDGNDTYVWPPGTLTDCVDLGDGDNQATIFGNNNANDAFLLTRSGQDALFQRTNLVQFAVLLRNVQTVNLQPGSGDDTVTIANLRGTAVDTVNVMAGDGNDTLDRTQARGVRIVSDAEIVLR